MAVKWSVGETYSGIGEITTKWRYFAPARSIRFHGQRTLPGVKGCLGRTIAK